MVKAKGKMHDGGQLLILGLSHENLRRLKNGQPITFETKSNLGDLLEGVTRLLIFSEETEKKMGDTLGMQFPPDSLTVYN